MQHFANVDDYNWKKDDYAYREYNIKKGTYAKSPVTNMYDCDYVQKTVLHHERPPLQILKHLLSIR